MRHQKKGRKLKRTSSHKRSLLNNLATALFEHKRISTTEAKAKELRPFAEKLITKAKHAILRETQGTLPEGQTVDIHSRRMVYRFIRKKAVLQELFDTIAPMVKERPGGYTRIIKTGQRLGDGSHTAIIELVDWSSPQDGPTDLKSKKKSKSRRSKKISESKVDIISKKGKVEAEDVDNVAVEVKSEEASEELQIEEIESTTVENEISNKVNESEETSVDSVEEDVKNEITKDEVIETETEIREERATDDSDEKSNDTSDEQKDS